MLGCGGAFAELSFAQVDAGDALPNTWFKCMGDLDGDGRADLLGPRHYLLNPGDRAASWTARPFNSDWNNYAAMTTADMNGDGRPDLIMTCSENNPGPLAWFENPLPASSPAAWPRHVIDEGPLNSCHSVWTADINRDGELDVVTSEFRAPYRVLIYPGDGKGGFMREVIGTTELHHVAPGDYDADGHVDLFGTLVFDAGPIKVFRNDGKYAAALVGPPPVGGPRAANRVLRDLLGRRRAAARFQFLAPAPGLLGPNLPGSLSPLAGPDTWE